MLPDGAYVHSRHDGIEGRSGAREAQQFQRDGDWLWRIRWMPDPRYPSFPWAVVAYPWWRVREADGISPQGEVIPLARAVDDCPDTDCGASWYGGGATCPRCGKARW